MALPNSRLSNELVPFQRGCDGDRAAFLAGTRGGYFQALDFAQAPQANAPLRVRARGQADVVLDGLPNVAPPVGLDNVTVNVSLGSSRVSFVIGTENVLLAVSALAHDRVPLVAV